MTSQEELLVMMLKVSPFPISAAVLLQSFIQEEGPLTEEVAEKICEILARKRWLSG